MNDNQILSLTREVDDILAALCVKHSVTPLSLGAVTIARLLWACRETEAEGDFLSLMDIISRGQFEQSQPAPIQH